MNTQNTEKNSLDLTFTGNIFLFYAFDLGDDINLNKIRESNVVKIAHRTWPKYFKHYHVPLSLDIPVPKHTVKVLRANLHHFGALSLLYKIPFKGTLAELRSKLLKLDSHYQQHSVDDAYGIYKKIKPYVNQAKFFHHMTSYPMIHVNPQQELEGAQLIERFGSIIASTLRFEMSTISPYQKNEILHSTTGYYREDVVIIDTEASFIYDAEPYELLDFFELALIQQLELQYFDKLLDKKLDAVYGQATQKVSPYSYLPFVGTLYDPLSELTKLKVDISVITERLDNSIRLMGEAYYSEIYNLLIKKLEVESWRSSVEKKLAIVHDVRAIYQTKINTVREDMLSVLIIILIMIEVLVGLLK